MCNRSGQIVRATAGRDKGELFFVTGQEGELLLLANGKGRTLAAPKRKKPRHVARLDQGDFRHPAVEKLQQGQTVSDRELRRALAAFKEGNTLGER